MVGRVLSEADKARWIKRLHDDFSAFPMPERLHAIDYLLEQHLADEPPCLRDLIETYKAILEELVAVRSFVIGLAEAGLVTTVDERAQAAERYIETACPLYHRYLKGGALDGAQD